MSKKPADTCRPPVLSAEIVRATEGDRDRDRNFDFKTFSYFASTISYTFMRRFSISTRLCSFQA